MAGKKLRRWFPVLFLLLVMAALFWWAEARRPAQEYPMAHVAQPRAILWNANAQVHQPVATLHYGDHLTILQRSGERANVRTDAGVRGWLDLSALMDAGLWQQAAALLEKARSMPVQARGHTRTISNVRLAAGRDGPRIFQFGRNEPVVVLDRASRPVPPQGAAQAAGAAAENLPRLEDWVLVLRTEAAPGANGAEAAGPADPGDAAEVPIAGWVLARFIDLEPPTPIPDYFSAAGLRVVAWAALNEVTDQGGSHRQYLVAGARGGEGQPCDFTLLRVYTWGAMRRRYETAYIENDICGSLPIRVRSLQGGEEFRFTDPMEDGAERVYRMRQTTVRRVTAAEGTPAVSAGSQR